MASRQADLPGPIPLDPDWDGLCVSRMGVAALTRMAFQGVDLYPLWTRLMEQVTDDRAGAGIGMDLSVIAQLRGDKQTGLAIQRDTLKLHQTFRCEEEPGRGEEEPGRCDDRPGTPGLRLLALAAASDIGANTPLEFLVQGSGISLATLYLGPGMPAPAAIPAHDVAIVVAPASDDGALALAMIESLTRSWTTPVLNRPSRIRALERDQLCRKLGGTPGLRIPPTLRLDRAALEDGLRALEFPVIIRPFGSHAGFGLARLESEADMKTYLAERGEDGFFVSPFIDYSSRDGLFRKYRVALIGGQAHAVHMAIAEEWKVWYLNADMALSASNRLEEAKFMQFFDTGFGARHARAFREMAARIGLDYVLVDCAETREGELLVFEADHCAIVHDMDPVNVYPYKPAQMQKIFTAFAALVRQRAGQMCAA
jgi:hypothetical protein